MQHGFAADSQYTGPIKLSGFPAWAAWLLIHVFFLIGFRNRFFVLGEWAWIYFTYERGARLITGPVHGLLGHPEPSRDESPEA